MFKPQGVYPAMLGSYNEDAGINKEATKKMVDFYIDRGVSGLFPLSSVGGFAHLSLEQRKEMIDIVIEQNNGRVPVVPGAGSTYPGPVIELAKYASKAGCSGIVVCGPYYYKNTDPMTIEYFTKIADESPIPVILYNIPTMSTPVTPQIVGELMEHENVVGIKDSSGSIGGMTDMIYLKDQKKAEFQAMTGIDKVLYPMLASGAVGCKTAGTAVVPEVTVAMYDEFMKGNHENAKRIQYAYIPLMNLLSQPPFPYAYNAALNLRGIDMGTPIQPLGASERKKLSDMEPALEKTMEDLLEEVKTLTTI